ncbi:unnamed protein product [[Actinomadura] parvosata subsp. kistnae]|nr:unnamed protein product [Actinomadura parvosata subsp. kistnae]
MRELLTLARAELGEGRVTLLWARGMEWPPDEVARHVLDSEAAHVPGGAAGQGVGGGPGKGAAARTGRGRFRSRWGSGPGTAG